MIGPRPGRATCFMVGAIAVCWFLYVPIHELLHAYGCLLTGGTVTELQIDAKYGGTILASYFPFVVSGSDYAGRLSGFDTGGNDGVYLATVFMPFLLSLFIGVPLIKACAGRRRPILFGMAVVLGLAPFYNLPGDYHEMGSIMVTRVLTWFNGGGPIVYESVRSDDVFKLVADIFRRDDDLGLTSAGRKAIALILVSVSLAVAILLAFVTYALGDLFARLVTRRNAGRACRPA